MAYNRLKAGGPPTPLNQPACTDFMLSQYNNCIEDTILYKDKSKKERTSLLNAHCCKMMTCKDKDTFTAKNGIQCPPDIDPNNSPHFGSTQEHSKKMHHNLTFGVF